MTSSTRSSLSLSSAGFTARSIRARRCATISDWNGRILIAGQSFRPPPVNPKRSVDPGADWRGVAAALPPKAAATVGGQRVRFGPEADMAPSHPSCPPRCHHAELIPIYGGFPKHHRVVGHRTSQQIFFTYPDLWLEPLPIVSVWRFGRAVGGPNVRGSPRRHRNSRRWDTLPPLDLRCRAGSPAQPFAFPPVRPILCFQAATIARRPLVGFGD